MVRLRHAALGVNFINIYCRTSSFRLLTPAIDARASRSAKLKLRIEGWRIVRT